MDIFGCYMGCLIQIDAPNLITTSSITTLSASRFILSVPRGTTLGNLTEI